MDGYTPFWLHYRLGTFLEWMGSRQGEPNAHRLRLSTFQEETRCKNALHLTLITTYGLKFNEYAGRIQKVITMDDLFRM